MGEGGNKGFRRARSDNVQPLPSHPGLTGPAPTPGESWRQLPAVITRPFGMKFFYPFRTAALVPAYGTGSSSIMPAAVLEIGMW
jgi:hypothetical protein